MIEESDIEDDPRLAMLLDELAPRLQTPKAELVAEVETLLSELLGLKVEQAFQTVAARQRHAAPSLNLDRVHKSALVLVAHVLTVAKIRAG